METSFNFKICKEKKMQRQTNEGREMEHLERLNASPNDTFATHETSPWSNICFGLTLIILSINALLYLAQRQTTLPNPMQPYATLRNPTQTYITPRNPTQLHAKLRNPT